MGKDKVDKLIQIAELYKEGLLTKEEFEQEKKRILSMKESNEEVVRNERIKIEEKKPGLPNPQIIQPGWKENQSLYPTSTTKNSSNKNKVIYLVSALIILIGIGVFIGLYQHHQSTVVKQREQARLDSITEVERQLEIKRQESIAQIERKREEYEKFIQNNPVLISSLLTSSYEYPYLNYYKNIAKKLGELGFDKISSSYIEHEVGSEGVDVKCLKTIFQREGITVTLISQKEDINNVYDTEINFSSSADLNQFLKSAKKIGFSKKRDDFYVYGESWGWYILIDGNKVLISYVS